MQDELLEYYAAFDEDQRLTRQNITRIEFDTTTHVLSKYVQGEENLTELGAATGRYSLHYAAHGCSVTAVELVPELVSVLVRKTEAHAFDISIHEANATTVPFISDNSQDVVLILGPLYHIQNGDERHAVLSEANRILKPGGIVAVAYISRYFVAGLLAKMSPRFVVPSVLHELNETGLVNNKEADPFFRTGYFSTPYEMEELVTNAQFDVKEHISTDGFGRYISSEVNALDEASYQNWLDYHLSTCHEPSLLGSSNHGLVIAQKSS